MRADGATTRFNVRKISYDADALAALLPAEMDQRLEICERAREVADEMAAEMGEE
jgi:hypothetical protein